MKLHRDTMTIEYVKDADKYVISILGELTDFEHMLKRTAAATHASVVALNPGLSGAAVFLVRRVDAGRPLLPWAIKIAKDPELILSERNNYDEFVRDRLATAPNLIEYGARLLIYEFGGPLANRELLTLRSGYSATSPGALATLMDRLVTELHPLHELAHDSMSAIERMKLSPPLHEQVQQIGVRLPEDLARTLVDSWESAQKVPSRFPNMRSGGHGDLNAGNVMFEPGEAASYPVIIDFASMRKDGSPNHPLFWDYAKIERDIKTRMFLKEALANGCHEEDIVAAVHALDSGGALPPASPPAIEKLWATIHALRSSVQKKYAADQFDPCYRLSVAFATLHVFYRQQPDSDVDLRVQYRVAATSAIALLSYLQPRLGVQAEAPIPARVARQSEVPTGKSEDGLLALSTEYVKSIDAHNFRSLRVYQERIRREFSGPTSLPSLLHRCESVRTFLAMGRDNLPMSDEEYSAFRSTLCIVADTFAEVSESVLDWLATHGEYVHDAAKSGAEAISMLPDSIAELARHGRSGDYDWENIGRLLRTLKTLCDFDLNLASLGFVNEPPIARDSWARPLVAVSCYAQDETAPAIAVLDGVTSGPEAARFVARRKPLTSPQLVATGEGDWRLFSQDDDYIYEWSPKANTPTRQYGVRDKRLLSYCVSGLAGHSTVYALAAGRRLYKYSHDGVAEVHKQALPGHSLIRLEGSAWPAVLHTTNDTATFRLPQIDGAVRTLQVFARSREGGRGRGIQVTNHVEEGPDVSLSLSIPSDMTFDLRRVQAAGCGYVALKYQSTIKLQTYHHLCLIDLNNLAALPWTMTTSYRFFDVCFVRLRHLNVIAATHLIDRATTHCLSVWRLSSQSQLVQESLMDVAERGDATDLHVTSVGEDTFDAVYCFRSRDSEADEIRRFTWPTMQESALLARTPPLSRETDSAVFPEFNG